MDSVVSWLLITIICFYAGIKIFITFVNEQEKRKRQSEYFWILEGK
nr:MAG TPA: hypothetical protein [Caudoviricetes sp.]